MSGRPQDKTRTRCGNAADKSEDVHTLTVVKEVTVVKEDLNTTHPPTRSELRLYRRWRRARQGGWV
jgi:hypothetical protein